MHKRTEVVILIGFGKIASDILEYLIAQRKIWGYELQFIEFESYPTSRIEKVCQDNQVGFLRLHDKAAVTRRLEGYERQTLIVSAGNKYLFPASVIRKENLSVINFHNALLPHFPGRNAPSWAIWNGAEESGATWHLVSEGVDEGDCLWQRACPITEDTKAYELSKKIMEMAFEGFRKIFEDVILRKASAVPQDGRDALQEKDRLHYSWEIPGNGVFHLRDKSQDIYRLLRAVDYGLNRIFPYVQCVLDDGSFVEIVSYKKVAHKAGHTDRMIDDIRRVIYLALGKDSDLQLKYRFCHGTDAGSFCRNEGGRRDKG